jgi:5-methylcytosine-specific restriction endonuclease McrA
VPWANCGPDDPDDFDNLQVLCSRCNLRKGNRTVG